MLPKPLPRCGTAALVATIAEPQPLLACAACFGRSDSNLAQGMNWGIFSLLAVVVFVLGCIAAFFVYLAKRAAAASRVTQQTAGLTSRSLECSLAAHRGPGGHWHERGGPRPMFSGRSPAHEGSAGTVPTALSNDKLI